VHSAQTPRAPCTRSQPSAGAERILAKVRWWCSLSSGPHGNEDGSRTLDARAPLPSAPQGGCADPFLANPHGARGRPTEPLGAATCPRGRHSWVRPRRRGRGWLLLLLRLGFAVPPAPGRRRSLKGHWMLQLNGHWARGGRPGRGYPWRVLGAGRGLWTWVPPLFPLGLRPSSSQVQAGTAGRISSPRTPPLAILPMTPGPTRTARLDSGSPRAKAPPSVR
jgi:hypothetical protein